MSGQLNEHNLLRKKWTTILDINRHLKQIAKQKAEVVYIPKIIIKIIEIAYFLEFSREDISLIFPNKQVKKRCTYKNGKQIMV